MRFDDSEKNSQNSRIYDVLSHYGLMNRIYNAQSSEWLQQIDFGHVQQILKQDRIKSLNYLLKEYFNTKTIIKRIFGLINSVIYFISIILLILKFFLNRHLFCIL